MYRVWYLVIAVGLLLIPTLAFAQSAPSFVQGQIPSASQWNSYFSNKVDSTNGTLTGGTLTGSFSGTPTFTGATFKVTGITTLGQIFGPTSGTWFVNLGNTTQNMTFFSGASGTPSLLQLSSSTNQMISQRQLVLNSQSTSTPVLSGSGVLTIPTLLSALTWSGTSTASGNLVPLGLDFIETIAADVSVTQGAAVGQFIANVGAGFKGNVKALNIQVNQTATTSNAGANYVGFNASVNLNANDNGYIATFTGNGSSTNLTVSSVTGTINVNDYVFGTGVPAATYIVSQTNGTPGGAGVYVTNNVTTSSGASLTSRHPLGAATVFNPVAHWAPGATYMLGGSATEFDIFAESGSSIQDKQGIIIATLSADAVKGTRDNIAIGVGGQSLAVTGVSGWDYILAIGGSGAYSSLDPQTGWVLGFLPHLASGTIAGAGGLDFTNFVPTTAFMRGNNFLLDPSGNFTANSFSTGANAGVDCLSGVTTGTVIVHKGIVTHC